MGLLDFAAPIGAAADVVGGVFQNKANAKQAQLNRDFQERMSSTAFQRGVKDLQAAGLNPALAYGSAQASSPSGATSAPQQNVVSGGVSTALSAANLQLIKAQTVKTVADARKASVEADVAKTLAGEGVPQQLGRWQTEEVIARASELWKRVDNMDLDMSQKKERFLYELANLVKTGRSIEQGISLSTAQQAAAQATAQLTGAQIPAATAKAEMYKDPRFRTILPWLEKIVELFAKVF